MPNDDTPPQKGGYFPLAVIRTLLFGDEKVEDLPFKSRSSNDFAKVIKVPIGIGLYISSLDPDEEYFHVESFPDTQHSEIWLHFEWIESSTRNKRLRGYLEKERAARDKHNNRAAELIKSMPEQYSPATKAHLANILLSELHYERYDKVITLLGVAEKLAKYEQEDKNASTNDPAHNQGQGQESLRPSIQGASGDVPGTAGRNEQDSRSNPGADSEGTTDAPGNEETQEESEGIESEDQGDPGPG